MGKWTALVVVKRDAELPDNELRAKLMAKWPPNAQYQSEFGWRAVQGYSEAAAAAYDTLWNLKRNVDEINRDGWPRLYGRPVEPI